VRQQSVPNLIQALHLETKLAILRKRAEQEKVTLPKDVALYIAQNFRSISALASALSCLVAHSSPPAGRLPTPTRDRC
jgi:chromosomal replication initiator protein